MISVNDLLSDECSNKWFSKECNSEVHYYYAMHGNVSTYYENILYLCAVQSYAAPLAQTAEVLRYPEY